jgi:hypothetical protein
MKLKELFQKPLDRPIEGVIKADDNASLLNEIEEYVVTNEVAKRLEDFLAAYKNSKNANGGWISGFFGSGKSHLLKMLALILENRIVEGQSTIDLFLPKCEGNEFLLAELKRVSQSPSKSMLFNIDQKADTINKKVDLDALLSVFVKVFDEMCGYYGKVGHIARFERDLDIRGQLEGFRNAFLEVSGKNWDQGREQALMEGSNIAKSYAQISGDSPDLAIGILDKYRSDYKVSIEDFAEQVNTFIVRKEHPANFRVNFFVDEIGQYIADNTKLMTNLQTIAESLATKCRGRAWVIVTAQEHMTAVIGEMSSKQGNDFSKIQARFKCRMNLTSTNVAEVIQMRLLLKTIEGSQKLAQIYKEESNNFRTLFDISEGGRSYQNYRDLDHFVQCTPFVPYQFDLCQLAIENLSTHNAFEGRHTAVGERSMLGVFQEAAKQISDHPLGQLATFDLIYEGICKTLKGQIQSQILHAERTLNDHYAIQILKVLFLVKYVKEFKSNVQNICTLMLGDLKQDMTQLKKRVTESLNLLEQEAYIERNGDVYEFLTDEEKDVETAIRATEIETAQMLKQIETTVFDQIISDKKIRYKHNQDYPFTKKLDDKIYGPLNELTIHITSPFHEYAGDEATLRAQCTGRDELLICMAPDAGFLKDLTNYLKTDKYIQQKTSAVTSDKVQRILDRKRQQNEQLSKGLKLRIEALVCSAKLFAQGEEVETVDTGAQKRIFAGFHALIVRVHPHHAMLPERQFKESDLADHLKSTTDLLFAEADGLQEPRQEMMSFIHSNSPIGTRITVKALLERHERKPYGWSYAAILYITGSLCANGKLEARQNGEIIQIKALAGALCNSKNHSEIIVNPLIDYTESQVRRLKDFYGEMFDMPPGATEARALAAQTSNALIELHDEFQRHVAHRASYPILVKSIQAVVTKLSEFKAKPASWLLDDLDQHSEILLTLKETEINFVRKFWAGPQKNIFDEAAQFIKENTENFAHLKGNESDQLIGFLKSEVIVGADHFREIKSLQANLSEQIKHLLDTEKLRATAKIQELLDRAKLLPAFETGSDEQKQEAVGIFESTVYKIGQKLTIAVIKDEALRFEETNYPNLLQTIEHWAPKSDTSLPTSSVQLKAVSVGYNKVWIADRDDVELYIEALRAALIAEIETGNKKIQV